MNYLVYLFYGVAIKSWKLEAKDGDDLPTEDIDFSFVELLITYKPQTPQGAAAASDISMGWSFPDHEPR